MNECVDGTHDCRENANCMNNPGSFSCECADGYVASGRDCLSLYFLNDLNFNVLKNYIF